MTGTDIVPIDLAARRSSAANKAWETRRQRGWTHPAAGRPQAPARPDAVAEALARFDREGESNAPDWHGAALALKMALQASGDRSATPFRPANERLSTGHLLPLPAPNIPDYQVEGRPKLLWPAPVAVVRFADGRTVRAMFASIQGRPLNIGRGLRIAVCFYRVQVFRQWGASRSDDAGRCVAVPAIESCTIVDWQEQAIANVDAALASDHTAALRAGMFDLASVLQEADDRGLPMNKAPAGELCTVRLVRLRYRAAAARHQLAIDGDDRALRAIAEECDQFAADAVIETKKRARR